MAEQLDRDSVHSKKSVDSARHSIHLDTAAEDSQAAIETSNQKDAIDSNDTTRAVKEANGGGSGATPKATDTAVSYQPSAANHNVTSSKTESFSAVNSALAAEKEQALKVLFAKVSITNGTTMPKSVVSGPSVLSNLLKSQGSADNPFASEFSYFSGKGDPDPLRLKIYIPFSDEPLRPLEIAVKNESNVEDVIGYALFEYLNEDRQPPIPESKCNVIFWNMRIVEDDGTIDDDFPALERSRRMQKFSFDQFALCEASPEQVIANEATRKPNPKLAVPKPAVQAQGVMTQNPSSIPTAPSTAPILLKIHLYSTLEVRQTTTIMMQGHMLMSEVFDHICRKRKYDPKNYVLKMADTKTDAPMDQTLESLRAVEFCVLKRDRGGAGDIFLRPPEEGEAGFFDQPRVEEYANIYKQYNVLHKQLMGRHERLLTIDGDHIHIMPLENKNLFDTMKTTSFPISAVISCKQVKKQSPHFKLVVQKAKQQNPHTYEFEATSLHEAADACVKISFILERMKGKL
ncbi:hypothetical protein HDV05_007286 [Chytridiales sp. JEL 0842]|nr:hypothetical protein HDV05_007286 [Chytridiales sp. JEL 0842]